MRRAAFSSRFGSFLRPVVSAFVAVILVIILGVLGYVVIEGWTPFDALYQTVTTLSTVGFREVHPLSNAGMTFTMILIMFGVGVAFYAFSLVARIVVEGEILKIRSYYKMQRKIDSFRGHTIICGYGRLARLVAPGLIEAKQQVVIVERDPKVIVELEIAQIPFVEGIAFEDEVLKQAGIGRAKSLLALLPNEADNVYISLCARDLNPSIYVVARTDIGSGESRLRRAGANQVLAPFHVSAHRLVQQMVRPNVSNFLELAQSNLVLEEVVVPADSPMVGKTLEQSELRTRTGVIIAAVIDETGKMSFNPGRESLINAGSTMIVLGDQPSVQKLSDLLVL